MGTYTEKAKQKSIPATLAHALARCAKESYSVIWGPWRWEDLDRWKWVVIDVGVILDTSAGHFENFFRHFSLLGGNHSAIP